MSPTGEEILIIAGEESGDRLGGNLLAALRAHAPQLRAWGIGGIHLAGAGAEIHTPTEQVNVVGFWEVIRRYRDLRSTYDTLLAAITARPPRFAILIDFPGFNMRLARDLARLGIPVLYYVAPQAWAWKEGRVAVMARTISHLIVLFPFEVDFFRRHGIPTSTFGHPLAGSISGHVQSVVTAVPTIAYFPGSRSDELRRHIPLVRGVIERIGTSGRHIIACAESVEPEYLRGELAGLPVEFTDADAALRAADVALVKVGTSTLHAALYGVPFVSFYRTSWPTYFIARTFLKLPSVTMPNILAGRRIVEECVQGEATVEKLAGAIERLLADSEVRAQVARDLDDVVGSLHRPDAIDATARFIAERFGLVARIVREV